MHHCSCTTVLLPVRPGRLITPLPRLLQGRAFSLFAALRDTMELECSYLSWSTRSPRVAQRYDHLTSKMALDRSRVAFVVSATPAELLQRHQQASDVTKLACETAPYYTACC